MNEARWFIVTIAACVALLVFAYRHTACDPSQKGEVWVSKARFNRVETCDGANWVPLKIESLQDGQSVK